MLPDTSQKQALHPLRPVYAAGRSLLPTREDAYGMALKDLVSYVSRLCAQKPNCGDLYDIAARYGWDAEDVLAFLRCQKVPSKRMLRELAKELDVSAEDVQRVLDRAKGNPL